MKRILIFAGSNNPDSINRKIVEYAASRLNVMESTLLDLTDYPLPIYSPRTEQEEGVPESALRLNRLFQNHDGFIISVPEHNGSVPAFFKNALDWLSRSQKNYRVLEGKPVLLFSTSPGPGGGRGALGHAEAILKRLSGWITGTLSVPRFYDTVEVGDGGVRILDETIRTKSNDLIHQLEQHMGGVWREPGKLAKVGS